jgi:hypothetical protein
MAGSLLHPAAREGPRDRTFKEAPVGSTGLGLLLEEHRGEIAAAWKQAVARELGQREPALSFAVAPLLREMALALGGEAELQRSREAWTRCAVLVRSTAVPAQLAREFKLLHRCTWDAIRARGAPVSPTERRTADEWLDEALAEALDRLERVRVRAAAYAHGPVVIPARSTPRSPPRTPPPLPRRAAAKPPPLPKAKAGNEPVIELEPIEAGHP